MSKFFEPIDDFKTVDLPEKQLPFWKIAGPGQFWSDYLLAQGKS